MAIIVLYGIWLFKSRIVAAPHAWSVLKESKGGFVRGGPVWTLWGEDDCPTATRVKRQSLSIGGGGLGDAASYCCECAWVCVPDADEGLNPTIMQPAATEDSRGAALCLDHRSSDQKRRHRTVLLVRTGPASLQVFTGDRCMRRDISDQKRFLFRIGCRKTLCAGCSRRSQQSAGATVRLIAAMVGVDLVRLPTPCGYHR